MLIGKTLLYEIASAKDMNKVCSLLADLANEIRRQIASGPIALDDARTLAAQVAEIRSLLQELEKHKAGICRDNRDIPASYIELEGKIKEIRNDLDRMMN